METLNGSNDHYDSDKNIEEQLKLLKADTDDPNLDHGQPLEPLPDWFDKEKFKRGQQFFHTNYYSLFVSKLSGLLVILSAPRVLKILTMTQKSATPKDAFKRYLYTLLHMLRWYDGDVTDKESSAYKSLKEVYLKHSAANKKGRAKGIGTLSQSSLAITQFGFMGFGLLVPEKLGLKVTDEKDLEGFVHFWRVIGYLIGVDDRHNICNGTVEETRKTCRRVLEEVLWPYLKSPSKEFLENTKTVLEGMWVVIPFLDVDGFMAFTYDLAGLEVAPMSKWWSQAIYNFQKFAHKALNNGLFGQLWRSFLNFQMWLAVVLSAKFSVLAYLTFDLSLKSA